MPSAAVGGGPLLGGGLLVANSPRTRLPRRLHQRQLRLWEVLLLNWTG